MEEQLRIYHNRLLHITDIYERASALKELLVADLNNLTGNEAGIDSLDDALTVFYSRKECSYAIGLLEKFIAREHPFDLCNNGRNTHFSEKFLKIKNVICELFFARALSFDTSEKEVVSNE